MKIKEILIKRDGLTEKQANSLINEAKNQLQFYLDLGDFEAAENICCEYFGLEQDYLMELM